ncbi:MAG: serine--tRNA ligase [Candidatus Woesearchaeota archaeon]
MLDIKLLREQKELVIENLQKRIGYDTSIVEKVLELDAQWRVIKQELDTLKSQKNKESLAISQIKKEGGDIQAQLAKVKEVSDLISQKEGEEKEKLQQRDELLITIPNMLDEEVPIGEDDEENVPIRFFKEKPEFSFKIRNHIELCEMNNWFDLDQASKVSGSRFYYLKGDLVLLQLALYQFAISKLAQKGYVPVEVPPMLRREVLADSVPLEDFEEVIYKIEDEDLYLIGTSEHALAALHKEDTISHKDLPIKYAGISACFRKEAGVTKDSKGIFRVHNFNKIEQFVFSKPQESDMYHKEITQNAEEIFQELELHYQIVDICTGDMGAMATRKFDLEAWLPSQEKYKEMVSASNYRDFGARRLNCRYQSEQGKTEFVHTLNSTAIALTRCMIAILEQHQLENGNVKVPNALVPFIGKEILGRN